MKRSLDTQDPSAPRAARQSRSVLRRETSQALSTQLTHAARLPPSLRKKLSRFASQDVRRVALMVKRSELFLLRALALFSLRPIPETAVSLRPSSGRREGGSVSRSRITMSPLGRLSWLLGVLLLLAARSPARAQTAPVSEALAAPAAPASPASASALLPAESWAGQLELLSRWLEPRRSAGRCTERCYTLDRLVLTGAVGEGTLRFELSGGVTPVALSLPTYARSLHVSRELVTRDRLFRPVLVYVTDLALAPLLALWLAGALVVAAAHRGPLSALYRRAAEQLARARSAADGERPDAEPPA
jgi:hypothetical protein